MNAIRIAAAFTLIVACFHLACADLKVIDQYLEGKVESENGVDVDSGLAAVRELLAKSHEKHLRIFPSKTTKLINEILVAEKMMNEKDCSDAARAYEFDADLKSQGPARSLLFAILIKRDEICSLELMERERQAYNSLDETTKAQVNKYTAVYQYPATMDELVSFLEGESHEQRCQLVGKESEVLSKHVVQPCAQYVDGLKEVANDYEKISNAEMQFQNDNTFILDNISDTFVQEHNEFFQHMSTYDKCKVTIETQGEMVEDLKNELKTQC